MTRYRRQKEEIPDVKDFIIDCIRKFRDGWTRSDCFAEYLRWCRKYNYRNPGDAFEFTRNLSPYLVLVRRQHPKTGQTFVDLPRKRTATGYEVFFKLTEEKYNELVVYSLDYDDNSD